MDDVFRTRTRRLIGSYLLMAVLVLVAVALGPPSTSRLATFIWTASALAIGSAIFGFALAPLLRHSPQPEPTASPVPDADRTAREQALAAIDVAVALIGPDDLVRYANVALQTILGSSPESAQAITPPAVGRLVTACRVTAQRVVETVETGRPQRSLRIVATPLAGREVIVSIADVSPMSRMTAMRRDFIADASHELKTPIASIRSSAETLYRALEHDDKEASLRFATYIVEHAERLGQIVADLLDLSRIESTEVVFTRVDLARVASREVEVLEAAAGDAGIDLQLESQPTHVQGDERDLAIALRNLIENALRNTSKGGTITVSVGSEQETAFAAVSDTGRGIASRDLPRIFERFYRVDDDRNRGTGGTGLGLAIVKHVVENHGGAVAATSTLGEGSSFRLEIPNDRS